MEFGNLGGGEGAAPDGEAIHQAIEVRAADDIRVANAEMKSAICAANSIERTRGIPRSVDIEGHVVG